jgi:hypothetical protein
MEPNVCCGASAGGRARTTCQLYVGHDGEHAAMVIGDTGRRLRRWDSSHPVVEVELTGSLASGLAWAPGFPSGATAPTPSLAVVATNEASPSKKKDRHLHVAS